MNGGSITTLYFHFSYFLYALQTTVKYLTYISTDEQLWIYENAFHHGTIAVIVHNYMIRILATIYFLIFKIIVDLNSKQLE